MSSKELVIAIDFGTSGTGYAYAFFNRGENGQVDKENVRVEMNPNWSGMIRR